MYRRGLLKYCKKCDTVKIIYEFYVDRKLKSGRAYYCKECKKVIQDRYVKNNYESYIERVKEYNKKHPEKTKENRRKFDKSKRAKEYRKQFQTPYYRYGHNLTPEQVLTERNLEVYNLRNKDPFTQKVIDPTKKVLTLRELADMFDITDTYVSIICKRVQVKKNEME